MGSRRLVAEVDTMILWVLVAKFSRLLPEGTVNIPLAIISNRFTFLHVEYSLLAF